MKQKLNSSAVIALCAVAALLAAACGEDPKMASRRFLASGDQFIAQKDYAQAVIQYRNAVARDDRSGEARFKLGVAYEAVGDIGNALAQYVRAADLMPDDVDAQLRSAQLLLQTSQYAEARARATAALAKDPKNVGGLILLGNALAGMKDVEGAIVQLEEAIDTSPQLGFSYANLGLLQLSKGDRDAAEATFRRATEVAPSSLSARLNLANFYLRSGQRADAERELKAAFAIDPKSVDVNLTLAALYSIAGQFTEAEPYFRTFAAAGTGTRPKLALADFYLSNRKTKEAVAVLETLTKDPESFGPAKLRLANIEFQAGRRPRAQQMVEEVLERHPKDERALEAKAGFLITDRKYDEALQIANAVVEANPGAVRSHYLRGVALQAKGSIDEAIEALQLVLKLAPRSSGSVRARTMLATLYLNRGDAKTALSHLDQVVNEQPRWAIARFLRGQALLLSGEVRAAEPELVANAKVNPSSADSQIWLGRLFLAKPDFAQARQAFSRASELEPNSILALNGLVTLDILEKKPAAARARLEARLAATPNDPAALFLAGNSYLTIGDVQKAEAVFRRVLQFQPTNIDAYSRLAGMFLRENRLDEARLELEKAVGHQGNSVTARTLIGVILEMQNRPSEARTHYEQALVVDPRAAVAANNLAMQYAEEGNLERARQLALAAKAELPDDGRVSDTLGWIYYKQGLTTLALNALREATKQTPTNPDIHYHLGLAYIKNGDEKSARVSLEQALKLNPRFGSADDAKRVLATIKG